MAKFNIALKKTLKHEGVFSNHKYDSGGKTMYGITEETARRAGYSGNMQALTVEKASKIYKKEYWDKMKLDYAESQKIANELFDTGVNCGVSRVSKWLQEDLNVLNNREKRWMDIKVDGCVGKITMHVLNYALSYDKKNESRLLKLLNSDQAIHYKKLATRKETQEVFMGGWLDKRVSLPFFRRKLCS